ncbi:MAG TPA: transglutaminase domain-containing protein [Candidatus Dojkabacteria bacterium]|nr:transglutaminase domain-containing protein [Candidatus Dojkabacteria bacterium]HRP36365.1 transglutaminase domain-containing protein [Candidatus Dojkabacteria bacterium]HRP51054.1 transglutaminase domain-containing protein [Candidatus Dojkabacteria bacterium]
MKRAFFIIAFSILFLFGFQTKAFAADFNVEIEKIYEINSPNEIFITETRKITNASQNRLISSDNTETFQIIVLSENTDQLSTSFLSAKSFIDGRLVQNNKGDAGIDTLDLNIPYDGSIGIGQSKQFKIEYTNTGLTKKTGALLDIYAPGFSENYQFESNSTSYNYKTIIRLNKSLGDVGFVVPSPANTTTDGEFIVYEISQESLVGGKIWIQIGKTQYYKFNIKQEVMASDTINKGYSNEYHLVIPRNIDEAETTQKVFYTIFDPLPKQIVEDEDGNLIATFKIPSHENKTILIEGYAQVDKVEVQATPENSGTISDIDSTIFSQYLQPAEFWEVDNPEIISKANELKAEETNIYSIVESNYSHIVDTIDYSDIKRFGINDRQGALKTLQGGAAVCMEYSDLFLTLARAQGIPARAAFGYGYDARIGENQQDAHQWVQVYLPGMNEWLSVDVTWGESGPSLIGGDLNHFYTHIASLDPDSPPSVQRTSYGKQVGLEAPQFEIDAIETMVESAELFTHEELIILYPQIDKNRLELIIDELTLRIQTANIPPVISQNAQYVIYVGVGLIGLAGILFLGMIVNSFKNRHSEKTI